MIGEAKRNRTLAAGARNLADKAIKESEKQALTEIAEKYDRFAREADLGPPRD